METLSESSESADGVGGGSGRVRTISNAVLRAAYDSIGRYPAAVRGGDNPYEQRTEHMEGWNDALSAVADAAHRIGVWLTLIAPLYRGLAEEAILQEYVSVSADGDDVKLYVICNDTFYWGCADAESITPEELPALADCYKVAGQWGGELWAARKRGMRPQRASYTECYPKETWPLFDACGPERTDT